MDISGRRLTSLESLVSHQPEVLYCNFNHLENLIGLPESVKILYCFANKLTSLQGLSPNIKELHCGDNQLTSLQDLEMTRLEILSCSNNKLKTLQGLPNTIKTVCCYGESLESLFGLPKNFKEMACRPYINFEDIPWSTCYINGHYASDIKLQVYNHKVWQMGMLDQVVDNFYKITENQWNDVNEKYLIWKYRIGGEKWKEAVSNF